MKLLVIFTGGTIGSMTEDGWIAPSNKTKSLLINTYKSKNGDGVEFSELTPYEILSENLNAKNLTCLINCLFDNVNKGYDGIIVCHGTDTLQYSAAAAAHCLGNNVCPVVFVSSNYPLENSKSNGHLNFCGAVEFIKSGKGRGVFVSYSNDLSQANIHFAQRLLTHGEYDHKIFSLGGPYAVFKSNKIHMCKNTTLPNITPFGRVEFLNNPKILSVTATPFENYNYDLSGIKTIILTPYHSGTLNTERPEFIKFCKAAKKKQIPILLTGVNEESLYKSMQVYADLGITVLPNTTAISARVVAWIKESISR